MTNGRPKNVNGASASTACTPAEKKREYNARYYASLKENRKPQETNVVSTSSASSSREKRKAANARYYASRKESCKVSKICIGDNSESNRLIPKRTLQTNRGENFQFTREDVSNTQNPTDDSTPTSTLPCGIGEVMQEISRVKFIRNRIQPRTLLPQFCNVFNQPIVRDDNIQSHRLLNEATSAVGQVL
ncbi:hypothetical protein R6Q57_002113 [Mikania cordata]